MDMKLSFSEALEESSRQECDKGESRRIQLSPPSYLSLELWYMIFESLAAHGKDDLCNVARVCRAFSSLVKPILYRSVILRLSAPVRNRHQTLNFHVHRSDLDRGQHNPRFDSLFCRLQNELSDGLHVLIRDMTIGDIGKNSFHEDNLLARLVNRLPNLEHLRLAYPMPWSSTLIDSLCSHPRRPEVHLLKHDSDVLKQHSTTFSPGKFPCVTTLRAHVNPWWEGLQGNEPNENIPALQQLFFSCPNLRVFSLSIHGNYGGCVIRMPQFPIYQHFILKGNEEFPPIEELELDGYCMTDDEWPHWRDTFSKLSSLTLGPGAEHKLLERITGIVQSLRSLKLLAWAGRGGAGLEVDRFLDSFDTLESLEVRGYPCHAEAIVNHPNLVHLCVHAIESGHDSTPRDVFSSEDLRELDKRCPKLQVLEIDVQRCDDQWPDQEFITLATGFKSLRKLFLHFELGITNINCPKQPVLNYASAQDIGRLFFTNRGSIRIGNPDLSTDNQAHETKFEVLTLQTGESLRRFPQWPPSYSKWEKTYTVHFELRPPTNLTGDIQFVHAEMEEYDRLVKSDIKFPGAVHKELSVTINGPECSRDEAKR